MLTVDDPVAAQAGTTASTAAVFDDDSSSSGSGSWTSGDSDGSLSSVYEDEDFPIVPALHDPLFWDIMIDWLATQLVRMHSLPAADHTKQWYSGAILMSYSVTCPPVEDASWLVQMPLPSWPTLTSSDVLEACSVRGHALKWCHGPAVAISSQCRAENWTIANAEEPAEVSARIVLPLRWHRCEAARDFTYHDLLVAHSNVVHVAQLRPVLAQAAFVLHGQTHDL